MMRSESIPSIRFRHVALVLVAFMSAPGLAQSLDYSELEALFGEAVTTSVTGSPQRASDVPATMLIVTADDIRRSGARDLADVLRHFNGIDALRWSNSSVDVGVRGYNKALSSRVLVLVDGRQVYADHYGYTPWSTLPVELGNIRQIEVVKGPNSALFGFNATGGVINIVTLNPELDDGGFATVRSGSHDYREVSAGMAFDFAALGAARVSVGARRNKTFITPPGLLGIGQNSDEQRDNLRFDWHVPLGSDVSLQFDGTYTNAAQPIMVPNYAMAFEDMRFRSLRAQLDADSSWGLISASVYRNWIDDDVRFPLYEITDPSTLGITVADIDSQITLARVQDIFKFGTAHTVRLSGEYRESLMESMPYRGARVSYEVYSGGGMWNWQLGQALSLTSALRVDRLQLHRKGFVPGPPFAFDNSDWDRTIRETSYNVGLVWHASSQDVFRLVVARGAQLPNLFDLGGNLFAIPIPGYAAPLFISGLPDLQPSVVGNLELAWDRHFENPDLELRLALFRGSSRQLLADFGRFDVARGILNAPVNIGSSETTGLEASLEGRIGAQWQWQVGYIHQHIDDDLRDAQFPQWRTLVNYEDTTPRHVFKARLGWASGPWEVDAFMRYQTSFAGFQPDPRWIVDSATTFVGVFGAVPASLPDGLVKIPDYLALDLRAGWQLSERTTLGITGRNLLHNEQVQTSGLPVERSLLVNMTIEF